MVPRMWGGGFKWSFGGCGGVNLVNWGWGQPFHAERKACAKDISLVRPSTK